MRLIPFVISASLALGLAGCDGQFKWPWQKGSPPPVAGKSTFKGTVQVEFLYPEKPSDYFRDMKLLAPFGFVDSAGVEWDVPAGAITNGASVPPGTWNVVGGPYDGLYREAAVLHDYFVELGMLGKATRTVKDTNRMFFEAMRARGVSEDLAKTMYVAVQLFGPTWEVIALPATPAMVKSQVVAGGTTSPPAPAPTGAAPAPATPTPPSPGITRSFNSSEIRTLEDLKAWIARDKPSLEEIDKRVNEMRGREGKPPVQ